MNKTILNLVGVALVFGIGLGLGSFYSSITRHAHENPENDPSNSKDEKERSSLRLVESPGDSASVEDRLSAWHRGEAPQDLILFAQEFKEWAAQDPEAAFKAIQQLDRLRPDIYFLALGWIAGVWGEQDPEGMVASAASLTHSYAHHLFLLEGMKGCMRHDPAFALDWLQQNPHMDKSHSFTFSLLSEWSNTEPKEAFEAAGLLNDRELRLGLQASIATQFVESSPDEAFEWGSGLEPGPTKARVLGAIMEQMAYLYPQKAIDYSRNLSGDLNLVQSDSIRRKMVAGLADTHPVAASELLNSMSVDGEYELATQLLAEKWGANDLEAAQNWLTSVQEPGVRSMAEQAMLIGAVQSNPEIAVLLAEHYPVSAQNATVANVAAKQWARLDPASANDWMMELAKQNIPTAAFESTLADWVNENPEAANGFVVSNAGQFVERRLVPRFFGALAASAPEEALTQAQQLETYADRNAAISATMEVVARKDPSHAAVLLEGITEPEVRDDAAMLFAVEIAALDPSQAFKVAQRIDDPTARYQGILAAITAANEVDRSLAERMIEQANLPDHQKKVALDGI